MTDTAIATVWRVTLADGSGAALKLFHDSGLANEGPGLDWLAARDGRGAVRLLRRAGRAVLMEWAPGPSLGDLSRTGQDMAASRHLLDVAQAVHAGSAGDLRGLPDLGDWFAALLKLAVAPDCPVSAAADLWRARDLARGLLASQRDVIALHGDLHHDNVRHGPRGWLAFDAKGVRGERAYELANAFRNPKGAERLQRDPARIAACADLWSAGLGVARGRLLDWAAAKCALSIVWRARGPVAADAEFDLLSLLLDVPRRGQAA
ncbi:aminoglycoside phosphotransferase family protein [Oceanicola sp. 22II-s10i]|uniref:aminoglycoside phosphotransferase family protein n=1 Tax=Oceanicola sp. 22II-s10i TaxID=1317116 RepID=UPI001C3E2B1D|nr:aminoglycoside phosphotransferase family protein [Oceanicola sp. 22II-s10i]